MKTVSRMYSRAQLPNIGATQSRVEENQISQVLATKALLASYTSQESAT